MTRTIPRMFFGLLSLGACAEPGPTARDASAAGVSFDPFPAPGALCSSRRIVAYLTNGTCLAASGWSVAPVFPGATAPELRRYCRYHYLGAGEPTPMQVAALPGAARDPDCLVATPAATVWDVAHPAFTEQIDLPQLPIAPWPNPQPIVTWVAMIDTSPPSPLHDGEAWAGNHPHGHVLGRIVREAGCPDGPTGSQACVVHVHHELALPWVYDGSTWQSLSDGGYFGYQTDVAEAVYRAVETWLNAGGDRLVLNLSVGWLDRFGGDKGDSIHEQVPARSVLAALMDARCRGALTYAAAGNWSGGTDHTTGLIYPAAWTSHPAPTPYRCLDFGGTSQEYYGQGRLLEAVGGVDGRDLPIPNHRPLSTPRVVAPSFMGTATSVVGPPLAGMSGTSIGTAVASAAAAIAWAYVPDLTADDVATTMHDAGMDLGRLADPGTCFGTCEPVRRISVCRTLERACWSPWGGLHPRCVPQNCATPGPFSSPALTFPRFMLGTPDVVRSLSGLSQQIVTNIPATCGPVDVLLRPHGTTGPGPAPCPDFQRYAGPAHPNSTPQPTSVPCRACGVQSNAADMSVFVELDAGIISGGIHHPVLHVETLSTNVRAALYEAPGVDVINPGLRYELTGLQRLPGVSPSGDTIRAARLVGETETGEAWAGELFRVVP